ncbi:hypothetical protein POM88_000537 [Heracleum sosnowskyi]|uniref:Uncharacterized protein n=1 Tax=Heracleum sosnowskyi TaxID=360622 RepID=A0AAD8JEH8_9APIA|nr:hypothetical protein POM88_000537 [Heracleum sosnowskyi]
MVNEDGTHSYIIHYKFQEVTFTIDSEDMSKALDLFEDAFNPLVKDQQLTDFLDFIHYNDAIKIGNLNRKFLRKEWSFIFGTLLQVFACRKSIFYQLSAPVLQIRYSLAYGTKIDVGRLIKQDLCSRRGKSPAKRE